jgi:thiamine pyrophosphate-dependent acetolactate synthase large subunit-like protein
MIGTKAVYDAVMHCDLLLMAGTDYPYSNFLPRKPVVVQIDDRPQVLGRRAPTVFGAVGSMRPTLKLLLGRVAAKTDTAFFDEVSRARRKWDEMLDRQADPARSKDSIHPQAVARTVGDLAAPDASFIFDTGSSARSTTRPSGPRLARPTAFRPWTVRARSSRSAATAASTC